MHEDKKIERFQGLRGILALMVFLGHAWAFYESSSYNLLVRTPVRLFFDGQISVICFFALTGFFMKYEEWNVKSYIDRIKKRLIRLLPAYVITTLIAYVIVRLSLLDQCSYLSHWGNGLWRHGYEYNTMDLVRQLLFIPTQYNGWLNPAAWYMQVDVMMMFLMPLLIGVSCRFNSKWLLLLAIPLSFEGHIEHIITVTMGVFAGIICKDARVKNLLNSPKGKLLLPIAGVLGVLLLDVRNIWLDYIRIVSLYIQIFGAGLLLFYIANSNTKWLQNKYLVWFGNYSYEFYLIHMVVMLGLRGLGINHFSFILLVFVITLLSSVLLQRLCKNISNAILTTIA